MIVLGFLQRFFMGFGTVELNATKHQVSFVKYCYTVLNSVNAAKWVA